MPRHVVLFGDSIFDNSAYVSGGPDVAAQLRDALAADDRVTLAAIDGSVCDDASEQFSACPQDATHVIISAGGNDILHHVALLEQQVGSVGEALALLKSAADEFASCHRRMVEAAQGFSQPVAMCTIYDANIGETATAGMALFNDGITRNIHAAGLDLIDLRLVCTGPGDYANPIEPSVAGGAKIADAIARYVCETEARSTRTRVFT